MKPDFFLIIRKYKFRPEDLKRIIQIREARHPFDNLLFENFHSNISSLEFIEKFYKKETKYIADLKSKKCGGNCCNGKKDDILLEDLRAIQSYSF